MIFGGEKKGAKFCGFCCDMRRAVIILNILGCIYYTLSLIIWLAIEGWEARGIMPEDDAFSGLLDDETMLVLISSVLSFMGVDGRVAIHITLDALAIAATLLSMLGAVIFNSIMVGIGLTVIVANFIGKILLEVLYYKDVVDAFGDVGEDIEINWAVMVTGWIIGISILLFYAYAHGAFIAENVRGIMTKSNYQNEKHSCCCV